MSQAPHGKNDWVKEHYEQFALLVMLFLLFGSCVYLVMRILDEREDTKRSLQRIEWKGERLSPKDTKAFEAQLAEARELATVAVEMPELVTVSRERVKCIKCGRPIEKNAATCPFCNGAQPEIYDAATSDSDGDGLPDGVELALGLDPQDAADAEADLDEDGFTNLEEYVAGTGVNDVGDYPDPVVKLRVALIKAVPFYLRFVSVQDIGEGNQRFQLNMQSQERTYFSKIGDEVMGYRVEAHSQEGKEETLLLTRVADGRQVRLVKGRPVTAQELAILFCSMLEKQLLKPTKRLNDEFDYKDNRYKVIDIQRESVVIQDVKTERKISVPKLSMAERGKLVPAATAAPAAPAAAAPQAPAQQESEAWWSQN